MKIGDTISFLTQKGENAWAEQGELIEIQEDKVVLKQLDLTGKEFIRNILKVNIVTNEQYKTWREAMNRLNELDDID